MIEARDEMRPDLERTTQAYRDVEYRVALLGSTEDPAVTFHIQGTASSLYQERSDTRMVPTSVPDDNA